MRHHLTYNILESLHSPSSLNNAGSHQTINWQPGSSASFTAATDILSLSDLDASVPMRTRHACTQRCHRIAALTAIRQAFGTDADENGATLFVSHHFEEIGDASVRARHLPSRTLQRGFGANAGNLCQRCQFTLRSNGLEILPLKYVLSIRIKANWKRAAR